VVISGAAAEKDIEAGVVTGDDVKIQAKTNMQSASAFMSKMLLVFGLGRGNWNVGNNTQLTAARKRLSQSYASTVGIWKLTQSCPVTMLLSHSFIMQRQGHCSNLVPYMRRCG
jgi:hypothetical protein